MTFTQAMQASALNPQRLSILRELSHASARLGIELPENETVSLAWINAKLEDKPTAPFRKKIGREARASGGRRGPTSSDGCLFRMSCLAQISHA
jgi:hypothetical protein